MPFKEDAISGITRMSSDWGLVLTMQMETHVQCHSKLTGAGTVATCHVAPLSTHCHSPGGTTKHSNQYFRINPRWGGVLLGMLMDTAATDGCDCSQQPWLALSHPHSGWTLRQALECATFNLAHMSYSAMLYNEKASSHSFSRVLRALFLNGRGHDADKNRTI